MSDIARYAPPARLFADGILEAGRRPDAEVEVVIWERLLENGTTDDLRRWFECFPAGEVLPEMAAWLSTRGDRLSARSWAFWTWILGPGPPGEQCDLPSRGDSPWWPDAAGTGRTVTGEAT